MQHLIIGAGPAGVIAAETLRQTDPEAGITLIGAEPAPPYSRMAIPYILAGNIDESGSYLRESQNHFDDLNIQLLQQRVTRVDSAAGEVVLNDGSHHAYDKLLIATGSTPAAPPVPGIDSANVHSCWTLEDAREIVNHAKSGANVVLIGAGFIGCIILESLMARGVNLTVIEAGDRMVPRMMNDKAGAILKQWCIDKGVNILTSCSVQSIVAGGSAMEVTTDKGDPLAADLVIYATGVHSNIDFLQGSGVETDRGILVNDEMESSVAGIYAAGDVAQALDFSTGQRHVHAIQPTAADHGRIAALNMAGVGCKHQGSVNMNVLDTLGLISCSFGLWMGVEGGDAAERCNAEESKYINLQFDGDILVGACSVGLTQHVGVIHGLIASRTRLGEWKARLLDDPLSIMEAYIASTQELGNL
ncbi:MAG: FAD-dependent oxidoreductase [Sedimenticola sp.]